MVGVAFKDLCIDAVRPGVVAGFWGELLGQSVKAQANGDAQLVGQPAERTIWVNGVPEPQSVKNRVHLDVMLATAETEIPGAAYVGAHERWKIMSDPDGAVFCTFPPRPDAPAGTFAFELVVDCVDPDAQAAWWAERTGGKVHRRQGAPWSWIEGAAGFPYMFWVFGPVPEPKTVKNRVHWDVTLVGSSVADLVAAGATVLEVTSSWTVMADPEGNEFCAF